MWIYWLLSRLISRAFVYCYTAANIRHKRTIRRALDDARRYAIIISKDGQRISLEKKRIYSFNGMPIEVYDFEKEGDENIILFCKVDGVDTGEFFDMLEEIQGISKRIVFVPPING